MTSFFPCGRGRSLLQHVLVRTGGGFVWMSAGKLTFRAIASRERSPPPRIGLNPFFGLRNTCLIGSSKGGSTNSRGLLKQDVTPRANGNFLCEWRGFDSSHNNWEPAQSFVHGYTKGFIDFLKKHPEIGVLLTDCLSKPDRQVESDRKRPVVNRDPAFYGPQQPHSRADPSIPPPAVRPAQEPNEDQASSSVADLQRPSGTRARPDRLVVTCIRAWPN